jgi:hypothetical protein
MQHADTVCVGQSVTFAYAGNYNPSSYTWQFQSGSPSTATGAGPHTVTYTTPGCHPVILILNNNEAGTVDCVDSVCVMPAPVASIVQMGNSLQASPSGMSYQWYSQNPTWTLLPGETNQFLNPNVGGMFGVVVSNGYGCKDSVVVDFGYIGVEELVSQMWSIYPNPNDGNFMIDFASSTDETIDLRIINAVGEVVEQRTVRVHAGTQQIKMEKGRITAGVYHVVLVTSKGIGTKKLVVR